MSSVIKASGRRITGSLGVQPIPFSFSDLTSQADDYVVQIRCEATKIVEEARAEADRIREEAEKEGQHAALRALERVMDEKVGKYMRSLMPAMQKAVADIEHSKQEWLHHWQRVAVKTACAIAQRVIRRELNHQPEILDDWIREALDLASGCDEIRLHLNPTDCENLRGEDKSFSQQLEQLGPATVVPNADIHPGGCRVETKFGSIDQQIESQLKRIEQELT